MFNRAPSSISVPWMTESMEQAKNLLFLIFTRSTHLYGSSLYPFLLQGITFKNEQRSMFKGRRLFIRDESSVINNYTFFSLSFAYFLIEKSSTKSLISLKKFKFIYPFQNRKLVTIENRTCLMRTFSRH